MDSVILNLIADKMGDNEELSGDELREIGEELQHKINQDQQNCLPNPDLTFAYSCLAPLVTEALTLLRCNKRTECEEVLLQARKVIETATSYQILFMGKTPWP